MAEREQPQSPPLPGFLRMPVELRIEIYRMLLRPKAEERTERHRNPQLPCNLSGGLHPTTWVSSSCFSRHFVGGAWLGANIQTSILTVCRRVHDEALPVLYEQTQLVARHNHSGRIRLAVGCGHKLSHQGMQYIKGFCLAIETESMWASAAHQSQVQQRVWPLLIRGWVGYLQKYTPSLKTIVLHIDVDLTAADEILVTPFAPFHVFAEMAEFEVDIHIVGAWKQTDSQAQWLEPTSVDVDDEASVFQLAPVAKQMKEGFIEALGNCFKEEGKTLRLVEA